MKAPLKPKHFSLIRDFQLSDALTLANGCCGVAAMFQAMRFLQLQDRLHLYSAAFLVPIAIVFDVLDGRVARWRSRASPLGRELDSLADVISFGMAPAAIASRLASTACSTRPSWRSSCCAASAASRATTSPPRT